MHKTLISW